MIYNQFRKLPNGQYHFVKKPYMDGYELHECDSNISQLATVEHPWVKGIHKTTGKPMKQTMDDMDGMSGDKIYIIAGSIDEVQRERVKVIYRLRMELQKHFDDILSEFDAETSKSEYHLNVEKYPEALV